MRQKEKEGNKWCLQRDNGEGKVITQDTTPRTEVGVVNIVPVKKHIRHVAERRFHLHQRFSCAQNIQTFFITIYLTIFFLKKKRICLVIIRQNNDESQVKSL